MPDNRHRDGDSDDSNDLVYIAANGGRSPVYHTDSDCIHLTKANCVREVSRKTQDTDLQECDRCAGVPQRAGGPGEGHFETLNRLRFAYDPLSNVEPEEEDA